MGDGQENSSRSFSMNRVKLMIQHCTEQLAWQFMYICEDVGAFQQGRQLGIPDNGTAMHQTERGNVGAFLSTARSVRSMRAHLHSASTPMYSPSSPVYIARVSDDEQQGAEPLLKRLRCRNGKDEDDVSHQ